MGLWDRWLWELGYAVCHQHVDRILFFGNGALFVCARDTGLFVSFFTLIVALSAGRQEKRAGMPPLPLLLLGAAGVLFLSWDGLTSYLGWRESTNLMRFISGFAGGAGLALPASALFNREVLRGDPTMKVLGDARGFLRAAAFLGPAFLLYAFRPAALFRLGQIWLLVCMLGTFFTLNLVLVCLMRPREGTHGLLSRLLVSFLLILAELCASYGLHRLLSGPVPGPPPQGSRLIPGPLVFLGWSARGAERSSVSSRNKKRRPRSGWAASRIPWS